MTPPTIDQMIAHVLVASKGMAPNGQEVSRATVEVLRKVRDGELVPKHEHYWVATGLGNESMTCMQCGEMKP